MKFNLIRSFSKKKFKYRKTSVFISFTLLQLLQHNVQLGALVNFSLLSSHWFIYGVRHSFVIINLSQTILHYRYFLEIVVRVIKNRRHILLVNGRGSSTLAVTDIAISVGEPYIVGRWVGGSLTNFKKLMLTFHNNIYLKNNLNLSKFLSKLKQSLVGLSRLRALPTAVFFNSIRGNASATAEAFALHIPSAGICDADSVPNSILYPIPGNDEAFGSVFFFNKLVARVALITKVSVMLTRYVLFIKKVSKQSHWTKFNKIRYMTFLFNRYFERMGKKKKAWLTIKRPNSFSLKGNRRKNKRVFRRF